MFFQEYQYFYKFLLDQLYFLFDQNKNHNQLEIHKINVLDYNYQYLMIYFAFFVILKN